nr:B12-binding domain-containing protein [Acidobacteriota bacterium]
MRDLKCLTTKEVARLCRVSDATVKRWEAASLLASERTSGGHRRFRAEEVARFQREQGLGEKKCLGGESVLAVSSRVVCASKKLTDSAFFRSLIKGCEEGAANVLIGAHLSGKSASEICDEIVCPAMSQIGERWASGKISITEEHLASRVAQAAIYKLRGALPVSNSNRGLAMCCAPSGDLHELPTHLAQLTIENEGWETINFGANTPFPDLTKEILRRSPAFVCLSATILTEPESRFHDFKTLRAQMAKTDTLLVVGGAAFADERTRAYFPADNRLQNFVELA